jgi:PAS domain S-box-containing protein
LRYTACETAHAIAAELALGAGAALLTPSASPELVGELAAALHLEPSWSEFPVVVLGTPPLGAELDALDVTFLDVGTSDAVVAAVLSMAVRARGSHSRAREGEQRFAQFMAHLPGLAWIKDIDGRYRYANPAAHAAFRMSAEELYGKRDADVFPSETARLFQANDRRALQEGRALVTRETLLQGDGRDHHSIVTKFPIPGSGRKAGTIGGMAIDITEWKETEMAAALLAAVVESSADAVISMTLAGTVMSWNAAAEKLYGYAASEAIGRSIELVVPIEHRAAEQRIRDKLAQGERIEHYESVRCRKDGRSVDVSIALSPIRDKNNALIGFSKIARDVSARKQTEHALRRSEEQFRLLAETAPCFVWTAAAEGHVQYANRQWVDYTGVEPSHSTSEWLPLVVHSDDVLRAATAWSRALQTGEPYEVEARIRRRDGEYRWFAIRAVPLHGADGTVSTWFGITVDINDQKELTENLRQADRHKDEFLATLGHELRNPLAPIRHSIEVLRMREFAPAEHEEVLARMERQVHHLVRLVDDLLQISRVSRGRIELRPERTDLRSIVNSAVDTSRPLIDAARHNLALGLPVEPLMVKADAVRVAQMVSNLLNNASKFTSPGGNIWLEAHAEGRDAVITVRDDGIGISAETLPRVFEMFTQGHAAPGTAAHDGLGIGLALVRILADLHGGSVTAASAGLGKGSQFLLRLPIVAASQSMEAHDLPDALHADLRTRILVVDDNEDAAESLGMLLESVGHDVSIAHDGATALRAARALRPDAVLLDIAMPQMDGYEVARRLRDLPAFAHVLLIAVSGYSEDRSALVQAGFDGYFAKPIDLSSLRARLVAHLSKRPRALAVGSTH